MSIWIFVNIPIKDLQKSMAFFFALGYKFNGQQTDPTAAYMADRRIMDSRISTANRMPMALDDHFRSP